MSTIDGSSQRKKVVLIQPPSPYLLIDRWSLPTSLLYLRSWLETLHHHVEIVNLAGIQDWRSAIPLDGDIYGVTFFTPQHPQALEIAAFLKARTSALLVAGAHHATALPQEFLEESAFAVVVRGEGELTFGELCGGKALADIEGISFKRDGRIIHNAERPFLKDIDLIPFPRLHGITLSEYAGAVINQPHSQYHADVMTSRGCPRSCSFCASRHFWKQRVRFHSSEYVIEHLTYLQGLGINDFNIMDDDFALRPNRVEEICRFLEASGSHWSCTTRSDQTTRELAELIKKSGCQKVSLGIESGSDRVLKLIDKQTTVADHARAIAILKNAGLEVLGFLMVGLPGEDETAMAETVTFLQEQPVDRYTISTLVPYPGTAIWKHPEAYGQSIDRSRPYGEYCSLNKHLQVRSIFSNHEEIDRHRLQLIQAMGSKCTNLGSFATAGVSPDSSSPSPAES